MAITIWLQVRVLPAPSMGISVVLHEADRLPSWQTGADENERVLALLSVLESSRSWRPEVAAEDNEAPDHVD
jgi:hypothetical protein